MALVYASHGPDFNNENAFTGSVLQNFTSMQHDGDHENEGLSVTACHVRFLQELLKKRQNWKSSDEWINIFKFDNDIISSTHYCFVKTYQFEGNLNSHKIENRRHVRRFESQ